MIKFASISKALATQQLMMRSGFCTTITKRMLQSNLFSIDLINKNVNRAILAMAYSPGVGAVCEHIQKDPSSADSLTLRGRSVAIVTDGSFLDVEGVACQPAMDWLIAQIKYYSGLDAFPFIIKKGCNMEEILTDLETSYGTVLYLDQERIEEVPEGILLLHQSDIVKHFGNEITDVEKTAHILAYLIDKQAKGVAEPE